MRRIAIEEHFMTEDYLSYLRPRKEPGLETLLEICARFPDVIDRVADLGEERLSKMDDAGIDMQVLSLSLPGVELSDVSDAITMAERTNDALSQVTRKNPDRFAGFAAVPRHDPDTGARELERAVKDLGLKGACVNSHLRGEYLDNEKYSVILETAEKLDVPVYIHPSQPSPDMIKPFLDYPELSGPLWGFATEGGLHAMRLIFGGIFDKYPDLKIILGHMGEGLPFWLWRMDTIWLKGEFPLTVNAKKLRKPPSQYVKDNFFVTTSAMFWQPALLCTYLALGADRILFAVDYPYESSKEAVQFMDAAPICKSDKKKIYHLNAEKVLAL